MNAWDTDPEPLPIGNMSKVTVGHGCGSSVIADDVKVKYSILDKPTYNAPEQYTDYYDEGFPYGPPNWAEPGTECSE